MSLRDIEYKVNKSLGPVDKILRTIKNPSSVLRTGELGRKIQSANQTVNSVKRMVDRIDDTLLSKADEGFFSQKGTAVSRVSEDVLKLNRFASNLDEKKYNSQITPEGKIAGEKNLGDLQYPPELGEYYLGITFVDYERPDLFQTAKRENPSSIFLPIPAQLLENHSTGWQDVQQGILGNAATQVANWANGGEMPDLETLGATYGMQAGQNIARSLIDGSGMANVLGVSGEAAVSVFQQYVGAIPNPSVALIFMGPTLRDFAFTWKFHPESPDESKLIKNIVNEFRKSMLPNLKFQNALNMLGYPRICELKLYPDEYLFEMKRCAVVNMSVNYAPNGVPTFFKGTKAPTSIEFTIFLKELEYFIAEDFGRESSNQTINENGVQ